MRVLRLGTERLSGFLQWRCVRHRSDTNNCDGKAEVGVKMAVVEVDTTGETTLSGWLSWGISGDDELPALLNGGVPDRDAFASVFDEYLLDRDRPAVRTLIANRVYGQLVEGVGADEALTRLQSFWVALRRDFSISPPFERPDRAERAATLCDVIQLERRSTYVAAARYLADHEHSEPPPFDIPADIAAMSIDALGAEADSLLESVPAAREAQKATAHFRGLNSLVNLDAVEANLNAAKSGSFLAAEGSLHTYLAGLGPLGYDNDSELAELEGIDLEADDTGQLAQAFLDDEL